MTKEELREIRKRWEATTQGKWYVKTTDDSSYMTMVYITVIPGEFIHDNGNYEDVDGEKTIAITCHQSLPYCYIGDDKCDENSTFIVHAHQDVPALLDEVEKLQTEVKRLQAIIDEFPDTISLETIGG